MIQDQHKPLRVAFIGLRGVPANYSGIEVAVEEVGARLASKGHTVTIYCMADQPGPRPIQYRGMKLRYIPCFKSMNSKMISYASLATLDALFKGYDLVHFHALGPATFSGIPRLFGKNTVVTVHGLDWTHGKWGRVAKAYLKFGEWSSARFPNATLVVSKALRDYYRERHGAIATYLPNGVPLASRLPLGAIGRQFDIEERRYVLFVGRLMPGKNVHQLIEAYRQVDTSMKLVIVGGSAAKPDYERKIRDLAAKDARVIVTGPLYGDSVQRLFANAYLYVLPSKTEGLPISLLEALSFGTPALASDIPANLEVLQSDGDKCGFTFPVNNTAALVDVLDKLVKEPALVKSKEQRGQLMVRRKYNWDNIVDSLEQLYFDLAAGRQTRTSSSHHKMKLSPTGDVIRIDRRFRSLEQRHGDPSSAVKVDSVAD